MAYAKALEVLTGANVSALLPIPDVSNRKFPEARKLEEEQGLHLIQYHQSKDYTEIAKIGTARTRKTASAGGQGGDAEGLSLARSRRRAATGLAERH